MMLKLGRKTVLELGSPGEQGRRWTDLRIDFDVKLALSGTPDPAALKVYNPALATVDEARRDDVVVRLLAGYETPHLLIAGEPVSGSVKLKQQQADRILELEIEQGGRALRQARIDLSLSGSVSLGDVASRVADELSVPVAQFELARDRTLDQGLTFHGPARSLLDRLVRATGARWTVQDGALRVLPRTQDDGRTAVVLSPDLGTLKSASKTDEGTEAKAVLEPRLRPGRPFVIRDHDRERLNGEYRATNVRFKGSTHQNKFEATAIGEAR